MGRVRSFEMCTNVVLELLLREQRNIKISVEKKLDK